MDSTGETVMERGERRIELDPTMAPWPEGETYIGIDPGLQGGIGVIVAGTRFTEFFPTPVIKYKKTAKSKTYVAAYDIGGMHCLLKSISRTSLLQSAALERPFASQITAKDAAFGLGRNFGMWEALIVANGIPYITVTPNAWMRVMHKGQPTKMDTKTRSIRAVQGAFPGIDLRRTQRSRRFDDNKADAILLAMYARRMNNYSGE